MKEMHFLDRFSLKDKKIKDIRGSVYPYSYFVFIQRGMGESFMIKQKGYLFVLNLQSYNNKK